VIDTDVNEFIKFFYTLMITCFVLISTIKLPGGNHYSPSIYALSSLLRYSTLPQMHRYLCWQAYSIWSDSLRCRYRACLSSCWRLSDLVQLEHRYARKKVDESLSLSRRWKRSLTNAINPKNGWG